MKFNVIIQPTCHDFNLAFVQFHVTMVRFGWWEDPMNMRDVLRFASMASGGQCVMMIGE